MYTSNIAPPCRHSTSVVIKMFKIDGHNIEAVYHRR